MKSTRYLVKIGSKFLGFSQKDTVLVDSYLSADTFINPQNAKVKMNEVGIGIGKVCAIHYHIEDLEEG